MHHPHTLQQATKHTFDHPRGQTRGRAGRRSVLEDGERILLRCIAIAPDHDLRPQITLMHNLTLQNRRVLFHAHMWKLWLVSYMCSSSLPFTIKYAVISTGGGSVRCRCWQCRPLRSKCLDQCTTYHQIPVNTWRLWRYGCRTRSSVRHAIGNIFVYSIYICMMYTRHRDTMCVHQISVGAACIAVRWGAVRPRCHVLQICYCAAAAFEAIDQRPVARHAA